MKPILRQYLWIDRLSQVEFGGTRFIGNPDRSWHVRDRVDDRQIPAKGRGMHWQDSPPHKAINFGAAFGLPDSPTMFRVSILRVPESDSLPTAFAEFWRRVLTEGPEQCSDAWTVLLVQMNLLGGGFTCVFTGTDLHGDEPPVFKFSSVALEAECYALPECEPGDPQWEADYQALEDRCLEQLVAATKSEPIAGYLAALRERRAFATIVCDFDRTKQWPLKL